MFLDALFFSFIIFIGLWVKTCEVHNPASNNSNQDTTGFGVLLTPYCRAGKLPFS
jgi:hypothetical protein